MRLAPAFPALLLLLAAAPAVAQPSPEDGTQQARAHLRTGVALYDDGRYDEAAREIEAAFALRPLPDLQYNLAQCYERLGRLKEAGDAYRRYLAGKPGADDEDTVKRRVANLDERMKAGDAGKPPVVEKERIVLKEVVIYREAPPPPGRGARFAAYGLGVLAVGALASGIAFSALAYRNAGVVSSGANAAMPPSFDAKYVDAQDAARTEVIAAWVGYGVAAAATAGAIGLFVLGRKIDREAPKLTLAPSLSPSGGGLAIAGVF